jgi:hypothetical protein
VAAAWTHHVHTLISYDDPAEQSHRAYTCRGETSYCKHNYVALMGTHSTREFNAEQELQGSAANDTDLAKVAGLGIWKASDHGPQGR